MIESRGTCKHPPLVENLQCFGVDCFAGKQDIGMSLMMWVPNRPVVELIQHSLVHIFIKIRFEGLELLAVLTKLKRRLMRSFDSVMFTR